MVENMLKEMKKRFKMLQTTYLNNSISKEEAIAQYNKLMFAVNLLQSKLKKQESAENTNYLNQIDELKKEMNSLKSNFSDLVQDENLIQDFKTHLPERISTDNHEEISLN